MAPHGDAIAVDNSFSRVAKLPKPQLSLSDKFHRTRSDLLFELSRVGQDELEELKGGHQLPPISEVVDAKCECCGMSEECTPEYIDKVRIKFSGKWLCGLCSEAVKEEVEKSGGSKSWDEALSAHMTACAKFKRIRAFPALAQADGMRQILKKSTARAMSLNPRDTKEALARKMAKPGIARSSSCIPAISRDINELKQG